MMFRRIIVLVSAILGCVILVASADARDRGPVDATPFVHAPCSVFAGEPCTPSFCSVLNHGPCVPEIDYPYGENLQLTIQTRPAEGDAAKYVKPDHDLDNLQDLFAALRSCWSPPGENDAHAGMEMSVRFSFKRDGNIIGAPRLTYATRGVSQQTRDVYQHAITDSLDTCVPLAFTKSLGGAIAGRPIMIRYVDNRPLDKQSSSP
jgi:hypothetical protein